MPNTNWYDDAPAVAKPRRAKKAKIIREDDVEGQYVKDVEDGGGLCLKVKVLGRPGYPDRLVLRGMRLAGVIVRKHHYCTVEESEDIAAEIVRAAIHFTELKKTKHSPFQPKQKTVIPKLQKMGYKVDIVHG